MGRLSTTECTYLPTYPEKGQEEKRNEQWYEELFGEMSWFR